MGLLTSLPSDPKRQVFTFVDVRSLKQKTYKDIKDGRRETSCLV